MKSKTLFRVLSLLSLLLLNACSSLLPSDWIDVQLPPERLVLKGFSFMPLNEQGWRLIGGRNPHQAVLGKQGDNPDETFAIEAKFFEGPPMLASNEEFVRLVKEAETRNTDPTRFKVLNHEVGSYMEKGNNCVRSRMAAEDHAAVKRSGKAGHMILEKFTLICVHPKDNRAGVNVAYSQRYYPDQKDPKFLEKATSILSSMEFTDL